MSVSCAYQIDLDGGKRIWVPPRGRPYWAHSSPRAIDLTDEECKKYLPNHKFEDIELKMDIWRGKGYN